jgi:hypothetical protein
MSGYIIYNDVISIHPFNWLKTENKEVWKGYKLLSWQEISEEEYSLFNNK